MDIDYIDTFFDGEDHTGDNGVDPPPSNITVDLREILRFNRFGFLTGLSLISHIFSCRWTGRRRYKDGRTWKHRVEQLNAAWTPLIEELTDAYVGWKYGLTTHTTTNELFSFSISVVDIHSLEVEATIHRNEETKASVALVQAGYLGTVPEQPSLAISLRTLELYHTLRLFKPSFSIEAFAKAICHLYSVCNSLFLLAIELEFYCRFRIGGPTVLQSLTHLTSI